MFMYSEKYKLTRNMPKQKKKRKIDLLFITACISTSLVLLLIGIVALLLLTANDLSRHLKQEMTVEVILKESITETQLSSLRRSIEASPYCAVCSYMDSALWLVPGVAFDASCRRLGRGKGVYDRLLTAPRYGVGVFYECQRCAEVPSEGHDRILDLVVTEAGCFAPAGSNRGGNGDTPSASYHHQTIE